MTIQRFGLSGVHTAVLLLGPTLLGPSLVGCAVAGDDAAERTTVRLSDSDADGLWTSAACSSPLAIDDCIVFAPGDPADSICEWLDLTLAPTDDGTTCWACVTADGTIGGWTCEPAPTGDPVCVASPIDLGGIDPSDPGDTTACYKCIADDGTIIVVCPPAFGCHTDADCGPGRHCQEDPSVPPTPGPTGVCVDDTISCTSVDLACPPGYECILPPPPFPCDATDTGCPPPVDYVGECVKTSDPCTPIACDLFCINGYAQDAAGCYLCECADGPPDPCTAYTDEASCSTVASCLWYPFDQPCLDDGTVCIDGACLGL